jgi:hypothetical protein
LGAYAQRDQLCDIPGLKTRTWYAVAKKIGKLVSARRMRKMTLRNPQAKSMLPAPKEKPARHKQPWLLEEDQAIYALIKDRAEFPSRARSYDHSETRLGQGWCTIPGLEGRTNHAVKLRINTFEDNPAFKPSAVRRFNSRWSWPELKRITNLMPDEIDRVMESHSDNIRLSDIDGLQDRTRRSVCTKLDMYQRLIDAGGTTEQFLNTPRRERWTEDEQARLKALPQSLKEQLLVLTTRRLSQVTGLMCNIEGLSIDL